MFGMENKFPQHTIHLDDDRIACKTYWRLRQDLEVVLIHMDQEQLTESQRFSIAVLAGLQVQCVSEKTDDGGVAIKFVTEKCNVTIHGGHIHLAYSRGSTFFTDAYNPKTETWERVTTLMS